MFDNEASESFSLLPKRVCVRNHNHHHHRSGFKSAFFVRFKANYICDVIDKSNIVRQNGQNLENLKAPYTVFQILTVILVQF